MVFPRRDTPPGSRRVVINNRSTELCSTNRARRPTRSNSHVKPNGRKMKIAQRHNCVASGDAATRTFQTKFFRYAGAVLLGIAVVLACSANAAAQQTIWPNTTVPATVDNG